ncbi:DnaJ domain-containing protein [Xylaria sp. FL0064]|nr:DnaJ domain-containing protein [Xylaria sp. FL0064]
MDTNTSPQQKRKNVNRILKLIQWKATHYELLGIRSDATTTEILSTYRKIALGIHPDKNDDKAANKCIQEINSAKAVLVNSERRRIYDNFIKNTSPSSRVETFGEQFAENAFEGADSEEEALEQQLGDEDSEDDVEARCPMPGKRVLELYSEAT